MATAIDSKDLEGAIDDSLDAQAQDSAAEEEHDEAEAELKQRSDGLMAEAVDNAQAEQPEEPDDTLDGLRDQLIEAGSACAVAEGVVQEAKLELKEAKATYDLCVQKVLRLVRELEGDEDRPLFAQCDKDNDAAAAPDPDAWRLAPITELVLWGSVVNTLTEAGAETVGKLEDLRAEIALGKAKWPRGIGEAKITQIENAVLDWLANNQSVSEGDEEGEEVESTDGV